MRLPGQKRKPPKRLIALYDQARTESRCKITFQNLPYQEGFEGRCDLGVSEIKIGLRDDLQPWLTECIAAHELCHIIQYARGYVMAGAPGDYQEFTILSALITSFILDNAADSIAVDVGFPMSKAYEFWLPKTGVFEYFQNFRNGRRIGNNWRAMWKNLEHRQLCLFMGVKPPELRKEYITLLLSLGLGNEIRRATNFGLSIVDKLRESIEGLHVLAKVLDDLLSIVGVNRICSADESQEEYVRILEYLEGSESHIFVCKPLTDEVWMDGKWQPRLEIVKKRSPLKLDTELSQADLEKEEL